MKPKIAIYVEDDINLAFPVITTLSKLNIIVHHFVDGTSALNSFKKLNPNIALLDINLNGNIDGYDVANEIRTVSSIPILFTTTIDNDNKFPEKIHYKNIDYLRKPFGINELKFRVNNILDLFHNTHYSTFTLGNIKFEPNRQTLTSNHIEIKLSVTENDVLHSLCENMGKFICFSRIINDIWYVDDFRTKEGTLRNVISRLRKILKHEPQVIIESDMRMRIRIIIKQQLI